MKDMRDVKLIAHGSNSLYIAKIDVFSTLFLLSVNVLRGGKRIIVKAGEELGGPRKETFLDKKKIDDVDTGLVICPDCLTVYSLGSLIEWYRRDSNVFKQVFCIQCGRVKLIDIFKVSGMIDEAL